MAIGIFGDSWVNHLKKDLTKFQDYVQIYQHTIHWHGFGGLTCYQAMKKISLFNRQRYRLVIVHVGGNDLSNLTHPSMIAADILTIREKLLKTGVERVMITAIPPRKLVYWHRTNTPYTIEELRQHEAGRETLNELLRDALQLDFIPLAKLKLADHYSADGIHLTSYGNRSFFFQLLARLKFLSR